MKFGKNVIAVAGVLLGLMLAIYIAQNLRGQLDLTEGSVYSLSPASRDIAREVAEPLTLNFYFSRSMEDIPSWLKNYATRVEDLLYQFERASRGNITVRIIDPEPDSEAEDAAIRAQMEGQALGTGESFYFGLQAVQADQERQIPLFIRDREAFLEYDIAELIYRTGQIKQPVLGVITSLPMFGEPGNPMMGQRGVPPWLVISQLQRTYDVHEITGQTIPEDVSVLAVLHPQNLSEAQLYAIDQFLLSGKPVVAAVDPSGFMARIANRNPMMMGGGTQSSNLAQLFEAYGVQFDEQAVVGDLNTAQQVPVGRERRALSYPFFFSVTHFNDDISTTSALEDVWLFEPGAVSLAESSSLEFTPLLKTTEGAGDLAAMQFAGGSLETAEGVAQSFMPDGIERTLAGIFRGTFASAFPDGRPAAEDEEAPAAEARALAESAQPGTLVVIADSDFLADPLVGEQINFLGSQAVAFMNDNFALLANTIDSLAGDPRLLALRSKGRATRPFDRVDAIRNQAQQEFYAEIQSLESELNRIQTELGQMAAQYKQEGRLVAPAEVRAAEEAMREQEVELRSRIREIRKEARDRIEGLKARLAALNILPVPLLIGVGGLFFFQRRQRR